jgi:hypothetical protein
VNLRWTPILDRLWLGLSGAAAVSVALQGGAAFGRRVWPLEPDAAFLAARAATPPDSARSPRPVAGCRDAGVAGTR